MRTLRNRRDANRLRTVSNLQSVGTTAFLGIVCLTSICLSVVCPGAVALAQTDHGAAHVDSADQGGGHADHAEHGADHVPHFSDINWFNGLIGEKEGVEPSLLWRPPSMPIPLGALIINVGILFLLIGKFGGPAIRAGLVSRKERIAGEILSASKMKKEAEQQLAHYEGKLEEMGAELERIKNQMREQAEADRERLVREAKEQRAVLEAEARYLIAQELAHARNEAILKAVSVAAAAARERIVSAIGPQDHERLAGDLRVALKSHLIGQNNATHREQS